MTTDALRRSLAVNRFWEAASSKEDSVDRGTLDNTKATGQSRIPERKISRRKRGPREPPDYQSVMGKFPVRWTLMRGRGAAETRPTPTAGPLCLECVPGCGQEWRRHVTQSAVLWRHSPQVGEVRRIGLCWDPLCNQQVGGSNPSASFIRRGCRVVARSHNSALSDPLRLQRRQLPF